LLVASNEVGLELNAKKTNRYIYIYIYIHTHTHTRIYTYIYMYIYMFCQQNAVRYYNMKVAHKSLENMIDIKMCKRQIKLNNNIY
jgi:hypothetical protein